jgi:hypothetical protein
MQSRTTREMASGTIKCYGIEIEDLQDVEILENRMRLSRGEISSIVFAKRSQQALMTDDKKAGKLACVVLGSGRVQSTPHLLSWLYFNNRLEDSDKDKIVAELAAVNRNLQPHLDSAYMEGLRCRLMAHRLPDTEARHPECAKNDNQKGMSSSVITPASGSAITSAPSRSVS